MWALASLFVNIPRVIWRLPWHNDVPKNYNVFRTEEGQTGSFTPLEFGTIVLSPEILDTMRRVLRTQSL